MQHVKRTRPFKLTAEEAKQYKGRQQKKKFMEKWGITIYSEEHLNDCSVHAVQVEFRDMKKEEIPSFLRTGFGEEIDLLEVQDSFARFICFLDSSYDPAEIDVVLYEVFGDYELGAYTTYQMG